MGSVITVFAKVFHSAFHYHVWLFEYKMFAIYIVGNNHQSLNKKSLTIKGKKMICRNNCSDHWTQLKKKTKPPTLFPSSVQK